VAKISMYVARNGINVVFARSWLDIWQADDQVFHLTVLVKNALIYHVKISDFLCVVSLEVTFFRNVSPTQVPSYNRPRMPSRGVEV
jgi:hypothetical protein